MLVISDLVMNKEMTTQAMAAVFGGSHGIGNYDHIHNGRWARKSYRSFYKYVTKHGRRYLALQKQWTFVRYQVRHIGRLRYVRPV